MTNDATVGGEKSCSRCAVVKPLSEFNVCRTNRDGRQYKCRPCQRVYATENVTKIRAHYRKRVESADGRALRLVSRAKDRAKRKKIPFALYEASTALISQAITDGYCALTGLPFDLTQTKGSHHNARSPSIDRIDPKGGYTPDNIRVVCQQANAALGEHGDASLEELSKSYLEKLGYKVSRTLH